MTATRELEFAMAERPTTGRRTCVNVCASLYAVFCLCISTPPVYAAQIDITGPPGSGAFGMSVAVLPNGNIVVTDPAFTMGGASSVGAAYLYSPAGVLISTLVGSTANDQVGGGGVAVLKNGNYVVRSPYWSNGGATNAGAATWGDANSGISGAISAANSLVGKNHPDSVGSAVVPLANGNYVVASPNWTNGTASYAGAVTWGNGTTGTHGEVSSINSLVGHSAWDQVGYRVPSTLSNGNYVVRSPYWSNGTTARAGAATWGDGGKGVVGEVSPINSLVGSTTDDYVGYYVRALANGSYVVDSYRWNNGTASQAGAVTWGDGSTGIVGAVSPTNSLVGTSTADVVGYGYIVPLTNGNYLVVSPYWHNGTAANFGAVTWGNGGSGVAGAVSSANSLVGTTDGDQVGSGDVVALANGNYVVASPNWSNGNIPAVGAVTWANGSTGGSGAVSAANSLIGATQNDNVGIGGMAALTNGNYVVGSYLWNNGAAPSTGAATWGDGTASTSDVVSTSNSLVGTTANDRVGSVLSALSNGNYVVGSGAWHNSGLSQVGAATWCNGAARTVDVVSAGNSMVGMLANDGIGAVVTALSNGNYILSNPYWSNGSATSAGIVTWGNGWSGTIGNVSASNSLVGTTTSAEIGSGAGFLDGITALSNGNYVVLSQYGDNGSGAATLARGNVPIVGTIVSTNSVLGGGPYITFDYDGTRDQLVVGRPGNNIVTIFKLDLIFRNGFE